MQENLKKIHQASMEIISKTGVKLHLEEAVELFKKNGQKTVGNTVFPTEEFLLKQIAKAPKSFVLEGRNPKYNMDLSGKNRHYASGYGCPAIIEADGTKRDAVMSDYLNFAKLVQASPHFKINGGILIQPNDVEAKLSTYAMVYATIMHSDKCLFGVPGSQVEMENIMQMGALVWGNMDNFRKTPKIVTMISTLSPLQMDAMALNSIFVAAKHKQALMISPGPMAGATGPLTLAGNIALGNAECVVALALCQMVSAGTPVIYGLQATTSDVRSGSISIGTPAYALQAKYAKALSEFYNLPSRCGGGVNDAVEFSAQSSYEASLPIFTSALNGVNIMVHSAGVLESWAAMSYEKFICDLELISQIEYYLNDLLINESTLAVDVINKLGPGGTFINSKHTLEHCRSFPWYPKIAFRGHLKEDEKLADVLVANINKEKNRLLQSYKAPELKPEIIKKLDSFMITLGFQQQQLDSFKPF